MNKGFKALGQFVKSRLSSSDFDTARRLARDSNAGGSKIGKPEALHNQGAAEDTIPGDLSEKSDLIANPSYVKTLRDQGIQSLNKLPAVDAAPLDPAAIKSLLYVCDLTEQGRFAPKHLCQFVRWVLMDQEPPEESALPAMDSALGSKHFPNHDRIRDTATVDLRKLDGHRFRFQGKAN